MSIRNKALLVVVALIIVLISALYITSQSFILDRFAELEKSYLQRDVKRTLSSIDQELADLETRGTEWSVWDDTYAFIETPNEDYIRSNLNAEDFINLKINLALFINSSGKLVFGKAFDLNQETQMPLPTSVLGYLTADSPLLARPGTTSSTDGILLAEGNPMLITAQPILSSGKEGPARGTLVLGRWLDSTRIERLAQLTRLTIRISPLNNAEVPTEITGNLLSNSEPAKIIVHPVDPQRVTGYTLIRDLYAKPVLVLEVNAPRDIYNQGETTITYLSLLIVVAGVFSLLPALWLLDRQVLLPLTRMSGDVSVIGASGEVSARLKVDRKDEFGNLASAINTMLISLQNSQNELTQSEELYRTLLELGTDVGEAIVMLQDTDSGEGMPIFVTDTWVAISGYSREELRIISFFDLVAPNSREPVLSRHRHQRLGEAVPALSQATIVRKDGQEVPIELASARTRYRGQWAIVIYIRDVTERKKAQEERERLYEQEKRLRQELEDEIIKRTEFTRALVHELRTPLTPVLASSELLLDQLKEERLKRVAKNIFEGAMNLNNRVEELLDLARGEIGMLKLDLQLIDPLSVLNEVGNQILPLISSRRQTLRTELPASLPHIYADEDRLRQILLNLVNNAVKFTSEGGTITLRARDEGEHLVIEVQDNGRGMSEQEQQRLFQPYFRLEQDRQRLSGLGLGLVLSKRLVELHSGTIEIKSQKGIGSTFTVTLPKDMEKTGVSGKKECE